MARVIFLTDFSEAYARELLLGMARYAHDTAQAWSLCRLPLSIRDKFGIEAVVEWAVRMKADAVIGQFYNTDNVGLFRENGIIAIAQDFKKRFTTIPNITGPHHLAGRMAAEYFLKKGFRNFAFYGTRGIDFSDERCQGFRETIEQANPDFTFSSLSTPRMAMSLGMREFPPPPLDLEARFGDMVRLVVVTGHDSHRFGQRLQPCDELRRVVVPQVVLGAAAQ